MNGTLDEIEKQRTEIISNFFEKEIFTKQDLLDFQRAFDRLSRDVNHLMYREGDVFAWIDGIFNSYPFLHSVNT